MVREDTNQGGGGVFWLNENIPDWKTHFLHDAATPGINHPNRAKPGIEKEGK
jgi:hypothetical protein